MKSLISTTPKDKKQAAHKGVLFVEGIPDSTKCAFKKTCVGRESMRDAVIKLLRYYVAVGGEVPEVDNPKTPYKDRYLKPHRRGF